MLDGKCALVTGSTSGIGWGIALALAKAGASIMLHGLEPEANTHVNKLRDIIEKLPCGRRPPYSNLDISKEPECRSLIEEATRDLGQVDILVNNAGVQYVSPVEKFPTNEWERLLKINLSATFYLSRAVLPQMYSRKWGRLIHLGSAHSLVASVNKSAYVTSKHGILGLSKVIALEAAGSGVTSNTICPGYVLTPLVQKQIDAFASEKNVTDSMATMQFLQEKQPSFKFVTPEQLGGLATFLCSDYAEQVTGAALSMDGGWTAR